MTPHAVYFPPLPIISTERGERTHRCILCGDVVQWQDYTRDIIGPTETVRLYQCRSCRHQHEHPGDEA